MSWTRNVFLVAFICILMVKCRSISNPNLKENLPNNLGSGSAESNPIYIVIRNQNQQNDGWHDNYYDNSMVSESPPHEIPDCKTRLEQGSSKRYLPFEIDLLDDLRKANNRGKIRKAVKRYVIRRNFYKDMLLQYYLENIDLYPEFGWERLTNRKTTTMTTEDHTTPSQSAKRKKMDEFETYWNQSEVLFALLTTKGPYHLKAQFLNSTEQKIKDRPSSQKPTVVNDFKWWHSLTDESQRGVRLQTNQGDRASLTLDSESTSDPANDPGDLPDNKIKSAGGEELEGDVTHNEKEHTNEISTKVSTGLLTKEYGRISDDRQTDEISNGHKTTDQIDGKRIKETYERVIISSKIFQLPHHDDELNRVEMSENVVKNKISSEMVHIEEKNLQVDTDSMHSYEEPSTTLDEREYMQNEMEQEVFGQKARHSTDDKLKGSQILDSEHLIGPQMKSGMVDQSRVDEEYGMDEKHVTSDFVWKEALEVSGMVDQSRVDEEYGMDKKHVTSDFVWKEALEVSYATTGSSDNLTPDTPNMDEVTTEKLTDVKSIKVNEATLSTTIKPESVTKSLSDLLDKCVYNQETSENLKGYQDEQKPAESLQHKNDYFDVELPTNYLPEAIDSDRMRGKITDENKTMSNMGHYYGSSIEDNQTNNEYYDNQSESKDQVTTMIPQEHDELDLFGSPSIGTNLAGKFQTGQSEHRAVMTRDTSIATREDSARNHDETSEEKIVAQVQSSEFEDNLTTDRNQSKFDETKVITENREPSFPEHTDSKGQIRSNKYSTGRKESYQPEENWDSKLYSVDTESYDKSVDLYTLGNDKIESNMLVLINPFTTDSQIQVSLQEEHTQEPVSTRPWNTESSIQSEVKPEVYIQKSLEITEMTQENTEKYAEVKNKHGKEIFNAWTQNETTEILDTHDTQLIEDFQSATSSSLEQSVGTQSLEQILTERQTFEPSIAQSEATMVRQEATEYQPTTDATEHSSTHWTRADSEKEMKTYFQRNENGMIKTESTLFGSMSTQRFLTRPTSGQDDNTDYVTSETFRTDDLSQNYGDVDNGPKMTEKSTHPTGPNHVREFLSYELSHTSDRIYPDTQEDQHTSRRAQVCKNPENCTKALDENMASFSQTIGSDDTTSNGLKPTVQSKITAEISSTANHHTLLNADTGTNEESVMGSTTISQTEQGKSSESNFVEKESFQTPNFDFKWTASEPTITVTTHPNRQKFEVASYPRNDLTTSEYQMDTSMLSYNDEVVNPQRSKLTDDGDAYLVDKTTTVLIDNISKEWKNDQFTLDMESNRRHSVHGPMNVGKDEVYNSKSYHKDSTLSFSSSSEPTDPSEYVNSINSKDQTQQARYQENIEFSPISNAIFQKPPISDTEEMDQTLPSTNDYDTVNANVACLDNIIEETTIYPIDAVFDGYADGVSQHHVGSTEVNTPVLTSNHLESYVRENDMSTEQQESHIGTTYVFQTDFDQRSTEQQSETGSRLTQHESQISTEQQESHIGTTYVFQTDFDQISTELQSETVSRPEQQESQISSQMGTPYVFQTDFDQTSREQKSETASRSLDNILPFEDHSSKNSHFDHTTIKDNSGESNSIGMSTQTVETDNFQSKKMGDVFTNGAQTDRTASDALKWSTLKESTDTSTKPPNVFTHVFNNDGKQLTSTAFDSTQSSVKKTSGNENLQDYVDLSDYAESSAKTQTNHARSSLFPSDEDYIIVTETFGRGSPYAQVSVSLTSRINAPSPNTVRNMELNDYLTDLPQYTPSMSGEQIDRTYQADGTSLQRMPYSKFSGTPQEILDDIIDVYTTPKYKINTISTSEPHKIREVTSTKVSDVSANLDVSDGRELHANTDYYEPSVLNENLLDMKHATFRRTSAVNTDDVFETKAGKITDQMSIHYMSSDKPVSGQSTTFQNDETSATTLAEQIPDDIVPNDANIKNTKATFPRSITIESDEGFNTLRIRVAQTKLTQLNDSIDQTTRVQEDDKVLFISDEGGSNSFSEFVHAFDDKYSVVTHKINYSLESELTQKVINTATTDQATYDDITVNHLTTESVRDSKVKFSDQPLRYSNSFSKNIDDTTATDKNGEILFDYLSKSYAVSTMKKDISEPGMTDAIIQTNNVDMILNLAVTVRQKSDLKTTIGDESETELKMKTVQSSSINPSVTGENASLSTKETNNIRDTIQITEIYAEPTKEDAYWTGSTTQSAIHTNEELSEDTSQARSESDVSSKPSEGSTTDICKHSELKLSEDAYWTESTTQSVLHTNDHLSETSLQAESVNKAPTEANEGSTYKTRKYSEIEPTQDVYWSEITSHPMEYERSPETSFQTESAHRIPTEVNEISKRTYKYSKLEPTKDIFETVSTTHSILPTNDWLSETSFQPESANGVPTEANIGSIDKIYEYSELEPTKDIFETESTTHSILPTNDWLSETSYQAESANWVPTEANIGSIDKIYKYSELEPTKDIFETESTIYSVLPTNDWLSETSFQQGSAKGVTAEANIGSTDKIYEYSELEPTKDILETESTMVPPTNDWLSETSLKEGSTNGVTTEANIGSIDKIYEYSELEPTKDAYETKSTSNPLKHPNDRFTETTSQTESDYRISTEANEKSTDRIYSYSEFQPTKDIYGTKSTAYSVVPTNDFLPETSFRAELEKQIPNEVNEGFTEKIYIYLEQEPTKDVFETESITQSLVHTSDRLSETSTKTESANWLATEANEGFTEEIYIYPEQEPTKEAYWTETTSQPLVRTNDRLSETSLQTESANQVPTDGNERSTVKIYKYSDFEPSGDAYWSESTTKSIVHSNGRFSETSSQSESASRVPTNKESTGKIYKYSDFKSSGNNYWTESTIQTNDKLLEISSQGKLANGILANIDDKAYGTRLQEYNPQLTDKTRKVNFNENSSHDPAFVNVRKNVDTLKIMDNDEQHDKKPNAIGDKEHHIRRVTSLDSIEHYEREEPNEGTDQSGISTSVSSEEQMTELGKQHRSITELLKICQDYLVKHFRSLNSEAA